MEESKQQQQQQQHQQTSSGGRPADLNLTDKKISPKEENIGSGNPSSNADEVAASANTTTSHLESTYTSGPLPTLATQESTYFYGGYDNNAGSWDDYHRYANANNLQVLSPAMYGDNASVLYHSGFGIDSQMAAYGQFSPMASPMSPFMLDGQLYSPHQYPSFLPQPPSPGIPQHGNQNIPMSQNEFVGGAGSNSGQQDRFGDNNNNVVFGPGAAAGSAGGGYYVPFGSFGDIGGLSGGEQPLSNRPNSESGGSYMSPQLTPSAIYPPPFGILGPYDQNIAQFSPQPRPSHGFGTMANPFAQNFPHSSSYQGLNYSTVVPPSSWRGNNQSRLTADRSGRRERDSVFISDDSHGDRNRGPRALKPKVKTSSEEISSSVVPNKNGASVSEDVYNLPDFGTDYENARFFVIKSYSEDNVHKSIKYKVWASTPLGNRKLDAAYHELKETKSSCPLFLLFSVNASGQFCGVAEMTGPVDFENDAEYWQQDRWSGQFPVKWCIIKDVPNSRFRHILLENNDNKPVTHSRDTQEVKLEQGIEILKIFKEHDAETSILDDFSFYDERERTLQDRKSRQRPISSSVKIVAATSSDAAAADVSINQLSDRFTETFKLEDGNDVTTPPK